MIFLRWIHHENHYYYHTISWNFIDKERKITKGRIYYYFDWLISLLLFNTYLMFIDQWIRQINGEIRRIGMMDGTKNLNTKADFLFLLLRLNSIREYKTQTRICVAVIDVWLKNKNFPVCLFSNVCKWLKLLILSKSYYNASICNVGFRKYKTKYIFDLYGLTLM